LKPAWPVLAAYAAALAGSLVASQTLVVEVARARVGGDPAKLADAARDFALSLEGLSAVAAVNAAVLLAVTVVTARMTGGGTREALRTGPSGATPAGLAGAIVGTAGLSLACGSAADLFASGPGTVIHAVSSALHGASLPALAAALVALCLLPAMAEEGLFRGLVQTRLAERWGRTPAIVVAAAAFGLLHLDAVQGTVAFVVGLYLGWLADRWGSIRPTIAAHAANNALFVALSAAAPSETPVTKLGSALVLTGALAACAGGTIIVQRSRGNGEDSTKRSEDQKKGLPS
jgi:membrane protease YdiL (CAAX protease family)